ncbi:MAG TPA: septal ring lytic transglycosylase RlpA family lipoprotein [Desulfobulbaceae bacterium]|nr:septal ring lytic transglycosylase RlpA family lipoprotein [Desulfobulbaceae bacterium]
MTPLVRLVLLLAAAVLLLQGCAEKITPPEAKPEYPYKPGTQRPYTINGKTYYPIDSADGYREKGVASWYGHPFHGRKTANGETYDMQAMTAAHKILPMNTMLLVHNLENGRETVVRINDRGPFAKERVIDLSYAAAKELDMIGPGLGRIEIIAMGQETGTAIKGEGKPAQLVHQDFTRGNYFVQVGSFLNRSYAERVARRFLDRDFRVVIQPYITYGYTYYRVQIYAGSELEPARRFERQILDSGFAGAFLLIREEPEKKGKS